MFKEKLLLIIFVVGLILRFIGLTYYYDSYLNSSRMMMHYEMAHQLTHGNGFVKDEIFSLAAQAINSKLQKNNDFYRLDSQIARSGKLSAPVISDVWGYSVLLALFWKIFGIESYLPLQITQVCFDAMMIFLIYGIAIRLFQKKAVAIVSSAVYACFLPFIFFASIANRDVFGNWGMIVTSFFVIKAIYDKKPVLAWLAGAVLAFFCWFRPFIIYIPVIFLLYSIVVNRTAWKVHFNVFLGTALPLFILFVVPFAIIYQAQQGTYKFISTNWVVANLWEQIGSYDNPYGFKCNDEAMSARAKELGYDGPGMSTAFMDVIGEDVMRVIKKHPAIYFKTLAKKIGASLTVSLPMGDWGAHYAVYMAYGEKTRLNFMMEYPVIFFAKALKYILGWTMPILSLLSLIAWRDSFKFISILPMLYLSKVLIHASTHMEPRFILEGYFPLIILVAALMTKSYYRFILKRQCLRENY